MYVFALGLHAKHSDSIAFSMHGSELFLGGGGGCNPLNPPPPPDPPLRGGTKSLIFHVTFAHTNLRHRRCVPIQLLC